MPPRRRSLLSIPTSLADAGGLRLTQLLLGGVLLLGGALVMLFGQYGQVEFLVAGLAVTLVATALAIAVPWHRFPLVVSAILPALDIVAITLLREASPDGGFALLWVFPAMWAAWVWGLGGAIGATLEISLIYWVSLVVADSREITSGVVLLPVTVAAAATIAYLYSSRTGAQRKLLERQSAALRSAVERATREEATLGAVLDAVDFGVAKVGPDGEVLLANAPSTALMRMRRDAGDAVFAADGLTRIDPMSTPNLRARRGEIFERELAWFGEAGDERRALMTTSRPLEGGDPGERLIITTDVTDEQLALRARNDLVSSVSHELRTPLTSILGYLELAIDNPALPEAIRPNLLVAQRNADRLLELVTDILTVPAYSRTGVEIHVVPEQFEFSELLRGCVEDARQRAADAGITIDLAGVEPAQVFGDPKRLAQVIENLVSNAIKYNSPQGRIDLGLTSDGLHSWFVVRDTGPGMSEKELPRIFDRFFRSDSVRNTSTHGHGLGLAITRDIVRAHGGEITVQSALGVGTTFVVRLPARDPRGD